MSSKKNVVNAFRREFDALLACLGDTVALVSDEDWTSGESNRNTPVHQACHCLAPIACHARPEIDRLRIRFRFKDPEGHPYPSRKHVLQIIGKTRGHLDDWIAEFADMTLVEKELAHPPLFKLIYLLRHSIVHLSSLREELHRRGYKLPVYSHSYRPKS